MKVRNHKVLQGVIKRKGQLAAIGIAAFVVILLVSFFVQFLSGQLDSIMNPQKNITIFFAPSATKNLIDYKPDAQQQKAMSEFQKKCN